MHPDRVELLIACSGAEQRIEVRDRGSGISQTVLAQALLPFYFDQAQRYRHRPRARARDCGSARRPDSADESRWRRSVRVHGLTASENRRLSPEHPHSFRCAGIRRLGSVARLCRRGDRGFSRVSTILSFSEAGKYYLAMTSNPWLAHCAYPSGSNLRGTGSVPGLTYCLTSNLPLSTSATLLGIDDLTHSDSICAAWADSSR